MSKSTDWYDGILDAINNYRDRYGAKAYKKNKLELLLRVSGRVDSFSKECSECRQYREEITKLVKNLGDPASSTKEERKNHSKVLNTIIEHLKKHHKLVIGGQYLGILIGMGQVVGLSFGIVIGKAFGDVTDGLVFGMVAGMMIGVVIGTNLEARAKKQGRII